MPQPSQDGTALQDRGHAVNRGQRKTEGEMDRSGSFNKSADGLVQPFDFNFRASMECVLSLPGGYVDSAHPTVDGSWRGRLFERHLPLSGPVGSARSFVELHEAL